MKWPLSRPLVGVYLAPGMSRLMICNRSFWPSNCPLSPATGRHPHMFLKRDNPSPYCMWAPMGAVLWLSGLIVCWQALSGYSWGWKRVGFIRSHGGPQVPPPPQETRRNVILIIWKGTNWRNYKRLYNRCLGLFSDTAGMPWVVHLFHLPRWCIMS